jgi:hypothetical protein
MYCIIEVFGGKVRFNRVVVKHVEFLEPLSSGLFFSFFFFESVLGFWFSLSDLEMYYEGISPVDIYMSRFNCYFLFYLLVFRLDMEEIDASGPGACLIYFHYLIN